MGHKISLIKIIFMTILLSVTLTFAQNVIEIETMPVGEISSASFALKHPGSITIKGTAASFDDFNNSMYFYAWILNSATRKVVWHLEDTGSFEEDSGIYDFQEKAEFDAGDYEIYFAGNEVDDHKVINGLNDLVRKIFDREGKFRNRHISKLNLTVSGSEDNFEQVDKNMLLAKALENAAVSINRVGDDESFEVGFTLEKDLKFRIYCIGEGYDTSLYDYGWITDAETFEIVWRMDGRKAMSAGGGRKNLIVEDYIELPAGSYLLNYITDDSHSYDFWNVLPPEDPQFWGITLWLENSSDKKFVKDFRQTDMLLPIAEIIKVRNSEYLSQGFHLKKDMNIRVYCMGEGTNVSRLSDYGWIVNADTRESVWNMLDNPKITHAGGAAKNRLVEETIYLTAGNYIAYYSTDDSHAFGKWNSAPPFNPKMWGITLWPSDKKDADQHSKFDPKNYKSENIIAAITGVVDDRDYKKAFKLENETEIRIITIGEGQSSRMYDYGWIEDEEGNVIWEMTYQKTTHAGGGSKNRLFSGTFSLAKGDYVLCYRTDDSHSPGDWNTTPPTNQELYGITISIEK
ncbi:MAG: hypothetical protein PHW27_03675 [Melioribacteraceae bacterium]|nr:hypothetical protein [Melioribacteraceae bacterium]